jgi:hypothetical protein
MNTELSQRLQDSAHSILDKLEGASSWTQEQAPLVVQEFLAWNFWMGALQATLLLIPIVLGGLFLISLCPKHQKEMQSDALDIGFLLGIICIVPLVMGMLGLAQCIKTKVAPRLVVIEKLHTLLK